MQNMSYQHSYVIQKELHRTKYHVLYAAKNLISGDFVVIKAIDAKWIRNEDVKNDLRLEAELCQNLCHPNIGKTIAIFEEDNSLYVVMEMVAGKSIRMLLQDNRRALAMDDSIKVISAILKALVYAHENEIVHRNLNAENILVDENFQAVVMGFGKPNLAWLKIDSEPDSFHPVYYVAPEIFHGEQVSSTSDIYSIGVILYQLLCNRLPWSIDTKASHLQQKQESLRKPVLNPEFFGDRIQPWLFSIINKCLMIDPILRLSSAQELLDALQNERTYPFEPVTKVSDKPSITPSPLVLNEAVFVPSTSEQDFIAPLAETSCEPLPLPEPEEIVAENTDFVESYSAIEELLPSEESPLEPEVPLPQQIPLIIAPEPISIAELDKPLLDSLTDLLKDEEIPISSDTSILESVIEDSPAEPIPVPIPPEIPKPNFEAKPSIVQKPQEIPLPKPEPKLPAQRHTIKIEEEDEDDGKVMKLKKTFRMMIYISMGILLFVLGKYYTFKAEPKFESTLAEESTLEEEESPKISNEMIDLIPIKADTVIVGSMSADADADEFPIKVMRLRDFAISPYEITQKQWRMVFAANPSRFPDDKNPIENITFYDAIEFCNAKSLLDGFSPCYSYEGDELLCDFTANGYRLPTEAEWEYAAKAGETASFFAYSGSDNAHEVGWFFDNSGAATNHVGKKKANKFGLYDMSGNVFEWVWNWYAPYSYNMPDVYGGATSGTDKVIRGGSWYHSDHEMRVTNRSFAKPFSKTNYIGFRVVRTL